MHCAMHAIFVCCICLICFFCILISKEGQRNYNMESLYDYGSRAGFWRLHRLFLRKKVPATVFAVGMALERNPAVCHALKEAPGWEIASHGYRWIDYQDVDEETEREHIKRTVEIHKRLIGKRPAGFYQGKVSFGSIVSSAVIVTAEPFL